MKNLANDALDPRQNAMLITSEARRQGPVCQKVNVGTTERAISVVTGAALAAVGLARRT